MNENKKKLIAAIAGLVLVVAIVVGLLLSRNSTPSGPSGNEPTTETTLANETKPDEETTSSENVNDYTESSPADETEDPSTEDIEESSPVSESTEASEESTTAAASETTEASTEQTTEAATTEAAVTPEASVSSVTIAAKASEYADGYKLTKNDLTVMVKFSDGTNKSVTDYNIVQNGATVYVTYKAVRSNTITVTYKVSLVSQHF